MEYAKQQGLDMSTGLELPLKRLGIFIFIAMGAALVISLVFSFVKDQQFEDAYHRQLLDNAKNVPAPSNSSSFAPPEQAR